MNLMGMYISVVRYSIFPVWVCKIKGLSEMYAHIVFLNALKTKGPLGGREVEISFTVERPLTDKVA
jgi:hypothetical protein